MLLFVHEILPPVEEGARECGAMSDSDASFDDYYASDDSDAMSGSDAEEYLVLDDETFGDVAAGGDETPVVAFRSLDAAEVRERQRDAVARVTAVLQISPEEAAPLLRAHKWNVNHLNDAWFADEAGVRAKNGLLPSPSNRSIDAASDRAVDGSDGPTRTCPVCFEEFTRTAWTHVGCGHDFCGQCWSGYLEAKVDDGPASLDARCPRAGCATRVPESFFTDETIAPSLSAAARSKRARFGWRSFVDDNPNVKWCVAPGCERAIEVASSRVGPTTAADVSCACGAAFCWACAEDAHRPVACATARAWLVKNSAESENMRWILAHTKPCPKCARPIEKSTGCMHMTCSQCKHDFCWMCLGPWADHGERTGGYYACNRYERARASGASGFSEEEEKRAAAKHSLERYTHYYERWAAHGESQRKALADRKEWETRKLRRLGDLQNTPPSQLRFIVDALAQVAECRRVMKWTYGFAYYRFETDESAKKRFFEFAQADAEGTLERLTEAVETELEAFLAETRDAAEFGAFRGKLAGLTNITHRHFDTLVVEIERGFPSVADAPRRAEEESPGAKPPSRERGGAVAPRTNGDARPDGVIRRISRGIREAVIGNGQGVASRARARAPDPSGGDRASGER